MSEMEMKPELINKGSYGCIFQPGFDCKGNPLNTKKFISKIQRFEKISARETEIGKKIQNIDHYEEHFAPVLNSCNISLAKIDNNDINKCDFMRGNASKRDIYNSNEIMYVGEHSLADHILKIFQKTPKKTLNSIIKSNYDLLKSYELLLKNGIIHYDVKENNIICETSTGNPIIIDFGLSFEISKMREQIASNPDDIENTNKDIFFIYQPNYECWCIDICFLNFMYTNLGDKWSKRKISKDHVTQIINDFYSQNILINKFWNENPDYKNNQIAFFEGFVGYTWRTLFDSLIKNAEKWDNYGLAIVYLKIMENMNFKKVYSQFPVLDNYRNYLIELVSSTPDNRDTIDKTMKKMKEFFSNNFEREHLKTVKTPIIEMSMDVNVSETIYKNIKKEKINQLKTEATVYSKVKDRQDNKI